MDFRIVRERLGARERAPNATGAREEVLPGPLQGGADGAATVSRVDRQQGRLGGRRIEHPVSLVDVAPTILAAVGIEPGADFEGHDLEPLTRDRTRPPLREPGLRGLRSLYGSRSEAEPDGTHGELGPRG